MEPLERNVRCGARERARPIDWDRTGSMVAMHPSLTALERTARTFERGGRCLVVMQRERALCCVRIIEIG